MILEKVKKKAREKDLSISQVEQMAKLGNGTIRLWDKSSPTVENLSAVAKVLDEPIGYFLE